MILVTLSLQNFRNFKKKTFEFSQRVTLIVGSNTSGKTNILEAIYLLSTGKSFRAELEKEIITYGEEIARVSAEVAHENSLVRGPLASSLIANSENFVSSTRSPELNRLEIVITTGSVGGKKAPKKKFLINGVSKRLGSFIGNFFAVLFQPEDLLIVTDSPSLRRKYLNEVLSVVSKEYRRALLVYEKALRQRNKVLERIREGQARATQLEYWDKLLIDNGKLITEKRAEFVNFVNKQSYKRTVLESQKDCPLGQFKIVYEKNEISKQRLEEKREKEILLGVTLVGPHRDDFIIKLKAQSSKLKTTTQMLNLGRSRDISIYGSRGEQRLAVLWLKLGELAFLEEKTGQKPVLLLDDIFSELDQDHRELVAKIIPNQQTIITTTEETIVKREFLKEIKVIELE